MKKWLGKILIGLIAAILAVFGLSLLTREDKEKLENIYYVNAQTIADK